MKYPSDIIIYALPLVIAAVILYFKLGRGKLRGRNLFSTGTPVKLTKRIEVETFISRDEFTNANKQILSKLSIPKWTKWVLIFFAASFVINILSMPLIVPNAKIDYSLFVLPLIGLVIFVWFFFFGIKKSAGKVYDATEFVKNKAHYVFDADYYLVDAGVTKTQAGWENINGYMETDTQLLIFTGPIQALFINKSNFAPGDLDTMRQFLAANFDMKKGLYS